LVFQTHCFARCCGWSCCCNSLETRGMALGRCCHLVQMKR
jgi:hypothetical protein